MIWFMLLFLAVDWVITIGMIRKARREGRSAGAIAMLELSLDASLKAAVKAEDDRKAEYVRGRAAGRQQMMGELDELRAIMFSSAVPAGTKYKPPRWFGIDRAAGPDVTVFWSGHRPNCQCNECTWPKPKAPFHTKDWRCDCKVCVAAFNIG